MMVGFQGDYSNDYLWWDNVEAITVTTIRENAAAAGVDPIETDISIARAFRGDIDHINKPLGDLQVTADDQEWSIPAALMGANTLRQADTITDGDSVTWTVDSVVLITIGTSNMHWLAKTHKVQFESES